MRDVPWGVGEWEDRPGEGYEDDAYGFDRPEDSGRQDGRAALRSDQERQGSDDSRGRPDEDGRYLEPCHIYPGHVERALGTIASTSGFDRDKELARSNYAAYGVAGGARGAAA